MSSANNTLASPTSEPDRYIRLPEVKSLTGFRATAHVYRLMARGEFPLAVKIGERAIAWRLSDITSYLASRPVVQLDGVSYDRGYTGPRSQTEAAI
jgi:prophage regulatory protein